MTSDVSGWEPDWRPGAEQLRSQSDRLKALRGLRITGAWVAWITDRGKWFADLPIVVQFEDEHQVEVCWQKLDELSITWNTVDVTVTPTAWVTWRRNVHPALSAIEGDVLTDVAGTEHLFTTRQARPVPEEADATHSTWLTGGIWLKTGQAGLHIFNALDENGLSNEPPERQGDQRLIPL